MHFLQRDRTHELAKLNTKRDTQLVAKSFKNIWPTVCTKPLAAAVAKLLANSCVIFAACLHRYLKICLQNEPHTCLQSWLHVLHNRVQTCFTTSLPTHLQFHLQTYSRTNVKLHIVVSDPKWRPESFFEGSLRQKICGQNFFYLTCLLNVIKKWSQN